MAKVRVRIRLRLGLGLGLALGLALGLGSAKVEVLRYLLSDCSSIGNISYNKEKQINKNNKIHIE